MDATITNLGSISPDDDVFLSAYKVEVKVGEPRVISGVTQADLDADTQLKQLVLDGKIGVSMVWTATDAALATQGGFGGNKLPRFASTALPSGAAASDGMIAFCTNGRKVGEGGGAGTGVPVYYDGAAWRSFVTDAAVAV
jgi:hypothetical protein